MTEEKPTVGWSLAPAATAAGIRGGNVTLVVSSPRLDWVS